MQPVVQILVFGFQLALGLNRQKSLDVDPYDSNSVRMDSKNAYQFVTPSFQSFLSNVIVICIWYRSNKYTSNQFNLNDKVNMYV